jgi:hypothetical protein
MISFSLRAPVRTGDAAADPGLIVAMALPIVERLRKTIEAENDDIVSRRRVDYEAYSSRKNQALLELNRLAPALAGAPPGEGLRAALTALQAKLDVNQRILGMQLKACAAVSDIIARAIREGQSDGTYTALAGRRWGE